MNIDAIPISVLFAATIFIMVIAFEAGLRLAWAHRRQEQEKEPPVSAIAGSILGLVAFMLAFTFGIVTARYDARKELVRNEAVAISTAYLRADFMSEPDRGKTKELFRKYVDLRLAMAQATDASIIKKKMEETVLIQRQLWEMAVINARKDMNSDVAALYIESVNTVRDLHALRVAVIESRIPAGIWMVLYVLVILGMSGIGYQTAISGSRRSWATPILALSFSLVIVMIATLDRPQVHFISVSQKPLADARAEMEVK